MTLPPMAMRSSVSAVIVMCIEGAASVVAASCTKPRGMYSMSPGSSVPSQTGGPR